MDAAGNAIPYGELATDAASQVVKQVDVTLRPREAYRVIGTGRKRTDALAAVTGQKDFATDLQVKGAKPTMVCRPPTHRGRPVRLRNERQILRMKGVTHVAQVPTGIAVRAKTFGQCIDAIRKMDVEWDLGDLAGEDDETILEGLRAAELPMAVPDVPLLAEQVDLGFEFMFRSRTPRSPTCARTGPRSGRGSRSRSWLRRTSRASSA